METRKTFAFSKLHFKPSLKGSQIIQDFFVIDNLELIDAPIFILPDLSAHLIIHIFKNTSNNLPQTIIVGPRSSGFKISRKNRKRTFIARFKPGVLCTLLKMPSDKFKDQAIPISSVFNNRKRQIEEIEMLAQAQNAHNLFLAIETFFLCEQNSLSSSLLGNKYLNLIQTTEGVLKVKEAARLLNVSERQLQKQSNLHIGLSPKEVIRIERFTNSLKSRILFPNYTWSDISYMSGYVDHSHLISEYNKFMRCSPLALFS